MITKSFKERICFARDDWGPWGPRKKKMEEIKKQGKKTPGKNIDNMEQDFDRIVNEMHSTEDKKEKGRLLDDLKLLFWNASQTAENRLGAPEIEGEANKNGGNNFIPGISLKNTWLAFIFLVVLWLLSGFYKVGTDENAVVLYFGKFYSIATPGLNYHIPYPFGKAIKVSVTRINKEEFGFDSPENTSDSGMFFASYYESIKRDLQAESLMLTGDENIADIDFEVQWKIDDVKNYLFSLANPQLTVRKATESAMREIIAKRPIDDALANKKSEIETEVKNLVQEILDSYDSGIEIALVQLLRVDPPEQVINAFRDVQTAKADKERKINEAKIYQNGILPLAKGQAEQIIQEAEAYKQSVIADAQGKAQRFDKIYNEYAKSKTVTRKRLYIDTMEEIMKNTDKVIIDENASGTGVVPYLPVQNNRTIN